MIDGYIAYQHSTGRTIVHGVLSNGYVLQTEEEELKGASFRNILSNMIWRVNTKLGGWCAVYDPRGKLVFSHPPIPDRIPLRFQSFDAEQNEIDRLEAEADRLVAA